MDRVPAHSLEITKKLKNKLKDLVELKRLK